MYKILKALDDLYVDGTSEMTIFEVIAAYLEAIFAKVLEIMAE